MKENNYFHLSLKYKKKKKNEMYVLNKRILQCCEPFIYITKRSYKISFIAGIQEEERFLID